MKVHAPEVSYLQTEDNFTSPGAQGLSLKPGVSFQPSHLSQGSLVLDIESSEELVSQTLKRPYVGDHYLENQKRAGLKEDSRSDSVTFQGSFPKDITKQGSSLMLEVVAGPSRGLQHSVQSTNTSSLPLTLGRVPPSDLLLKDSEVSGKHAMINWNLDKMKWELVDMGSLNGTLVNSESINHPNTGSRHWGNPVELSSGDKITLGTTTQINVRITSPTESNIPFGLGVASDPMAMRRGGKKLPMEDMCYFQWLLPGADQFGVFGVCDGHGGPDAAVSASKYLPEMVTAILSDPIKREKVLSQQDASDAIQDAFHRTEESMNHYYEGCTATLLLVWMDGQNNFFLQCGNVGDSACIVNFSGRQIKMTEDHRITSPSEKLRFKETGEPPIKDGDTRLCGINLARMLGDKFLKEQDSRFSSNPYVSPVVCINQPNEAFALIASDGLWDVISVKQAAQLVFQAKERYGGVDSKEQLAEKIANHLLNEARASRTKDNTSVVYLDFDSAFRTPM